MTGAAGRLVGRIALITGASRGIGAAVARAFADAGAHVVLVARTQGGLEDVDDSIRARGGSATLLPTDLTDFDVIDRMGAALYERFGRLDVVVGNAGILGPLTPVGHVEPDAWNAVMAINLTANFRLIRATDPLLRLSPAGRAIFVTSGAADGHHAYWGAYAASKGALEVLVRTWAAELANTAVRANLINPGATRTRMRAEAFPGENPEILQPPEAVAPAFIPLAEVGCALNGAVVRARDLIDAGGQLSST
ncbi:MAG TPA: SDR family NAD(P)-dependent oxidoreductase [Alphaproteobacteria bacterium]|jgi:NAD(P)-dependent dehydrogenase (short-subunit alcohol dehydrogenase family)